MRILVGPAHFGGYSHMIQLHALCEAFARFGHHVTYVTSSSEPEAQLTLLRGHERIDVVTAKGVAWAPDFDLNLGLRVARGEQDWQTKVDLVAAACDASERFFADEAIQAFLGDRVHDFDVALVDAGALCNHLLADALHPLPQVHYLCYPPEPWRDRKANLLYNSAVQKRVGTRLQALRASIGAPPKPDCQRCHVLTIVGHSSALVHPDGLAGLPLGAESCVGSVLETRPAAPLPADLAAWADASGGFVVVSLGSWADVACSQLGKDAVIEHALGRLGMPAVWKTSSRRPNEPRATRGESSAEVSSPGRGDTECGTTVVGDGTGNGGSGVYGCSTNAALPPNVRCYAWIPQRALIAHRHCRLLVCHGGANSISEAAAHGVPVVGLPVSWDQPGNVRMVERLQVGVGVPLSDCTADALLEAMGELLEDPEVRPRAQALAKRMQQRDTGANGAAVLVERAATLGAEMESAFQQEGLAGGEKAPATGHRGQPAQGFKGAGGRGGHHHLEPATPLVPRVVDDEEEAGWGDELN